MINKEHVQLLPLSRQDMVDWVEKAFNYISTDTQMVSWSFDVCGITTTDSSKVQSGSFYKSCMENASKHLQNDEEEDDFLAFDFILLYLWVVEKRKKNKSLKNYFIYF